MIEIIKILNQIIEDKNTLLKNLKNDKSKVFIEQEIKKLTFCIETLSNEYNDNKIKIKAF